MKSVTFAPIASAPLTVAQEQAPAPGALAVFIGGEKKRLDPKEAIELRDFLVECLPIAYAPETEKQVEQPQSALCGECEDLAGQLYDATHANKHLRAEIDALKATPTTRPAAVQWTVTADEIARELWQCAQDDNGGMLRNFDSLPEARRNAIVQQAQRISEVFAAHAIIEIPGDLPAAEELARLYRKHLHCDPHCFTPSWEDLHETRRAVHVSAMQALLEELAPWLRDRQACKECENRRSALAKAMGSWFSAYETDEENIQRIMREVRRERQPVGPEAWKRSLVMECVNTNGDTTNIHEGSTDRTFVSKSFSGGKLISANVHTAADAARAAEWLWSFAEAHGCPVGLSQPQAPEGETA